MEQLITLSICFTIFSTLIVLGAIVMGLCVFLYDYLKKNISIEKQIKLEKDNPDIYGWEKGFGGKEK